MSAGPRGMGRGLAAILAVSDEPAGEDGDLRHIPLELIAPNPRQPRRAFDQESLQALAESIRERGIVQPVLVRPVAGGTYELVAGERRWRAAQLAGMESVPALVRPRDDATALEIALIENMAREDLNPVEEARACAALVEELGLTREEVGRRVGRSRVAVSNLLRVLDLPDEILGAPRGRASSRRVTGGRCCSRRTTATGAASGARPRARAGRCASSSRGRARPNGPPEVRAVPRAHGRAPRPGGGRDGGRRGASAGRSASRCGCARRRAAATARS